MRTVYFVLSLQRTGFQDHYMKIITQCELKIKAFQGVQATINQLIISKMLARQIWGTKLEIIVTAMLFEVDIQVYV